MPGYKRSIKESDQANSREPSNMQANSHTPIPPSFPAVAALSDRPGLVLLGLNHNRKDLMQATKWGRLSCLMFWLDAAGSEPNQTNSNTQWTSAGRNIYLHSSCFIFWIGVWGAYAFLAKCIQIHNELVLAVTSIYTVHISYSELVYEVRMLFWPNVFKHTMN
jgi:hypothetical protein